MNISLKNSDLILVKKKIVVFGYIWWDKDLKYL